jgi:hypothetical protein
MSSPPPIGSRVEMLCHNQLGSYFETAVVVNQFTDPGVGVVLEMQLDTDQRRVQRIWPSPAIRRRP